MGQALSVVLVVSAMAVVGVIGLAFLGLMMSGDGTTGHLPIFGLYVLGALAAAAAFGVLAAKPPATVDSNTALRALRFAVGGAVSIVLLTGVCVAIGALINAR